MNRVIRVLILSDFVLYFALGLVVPIFPLFIINQISGGTLEVIGLSYFFYWLTRSITAIPISRYLDKTNGEKDEFWVMLAGSAIYSILPIFFIWSHLPWHIYLIQALTGLAGSMCVPGWRIIFTNHLDRGKTGLEWSLEDVGIGLGTAISAYVGAVIAEHYGFHFLFVSIAVLGLFGSAMLLPIYGYAKSFKEMRVREKLIRKDLLKPEDIASAL